jgi:hypothetical protein
MGMAMTFTLVTLLKDKIAEIVSLRIEKKKVEEREKERREIEVRALPVLVLSLNIPQRLRKLEHGVHPSQSRASTHGNPSSTKRWRLRRPKKRRSD